jgi:DNA-binding MarR family transcriptional regulator
VRKLEDAVAYLLWQAQLTTEKALVSALRPLELTPSQFGALMFLELEGPLSAAELARRLEIRPQSVAAGLAGLEQRGLVSRTAHPQHGRVLLVRIEAAGRRLARRADTAVERVEQELLEVLPRAERRGFVESLRRVVAR